MLKSWKSLSPTRTSPPAFVKLAKLTVGPITTWALAAGAYATARATIAQMARRYWPERTEETSRRLPRLATTLNSLVKEKSFLIVRIYLLALPIPSPNKPPMKSIASTVLKACVSYINSVTEVKTEAKITAVKHFPSAGLNLQTMQNSCKSLYVNEMAKQRTLQRQEVMLGRPFCSNFD